MADATYSLVNNATGVKTDLPAIKGTLGPVGLDVGKVYDNGTPAVLDFNLSVTKGEFIAFLGPSGCGKTTTLRMIAGFETISSGDMLIRGERMNDVPPQRRPTSMIFQNYALFPHMSVRRNVGYGLEVKGLGKAERVAVLEVYWPTSGTTQTFHDLPANAYVEVTEFASDYRERKVEPVVVPERPR